MTFEDLESWQQARQLASSVSYVIEDNYPKLATEAVELRKKAIGAGQLVGGLLRSTESRKTRILSLLSPLLRSALSPLTCPFPSLPAAMIDVVIQVDRLRKKYRLGVLGTGTQVGEGKS